MNALRMRVSNRLLEAAANQSLDCRDMWGKCERAGVGPADNKDLQVLALLEAVSRVAIRLGVMIMPRRPAIV